VTIVQEPGVGTASSQLLVRLLHRSFKRLFPSRLSRLMLLLHDLV
jgi:hypothetical protein